MLLRDGFEPGSATQLLCTPFLKKKWGLAHASCFFPCSMCPSANIEIKHPNLNFPSYLYRQNLKPPTAKYSDCLTLKPDREQAEEKTPHTTDPTNLSLIHI